MRSIYVVPLLSGLVVSQDLGDIPDCAQPCVKDWTSGNNIAGCKPLEIACVCANDDFIDGVACCLDDACDQEGKDAAVKYAQQICSSVDVDVPDEVVCKDGSSSSASASDTGAAETATDSATATSSSGNEGSEAESATDSAASETESPGAAPGFAATGGAIGALGAFFAALLAL